MKLMLGTYLVGVFVKESEKGADDGSARTADVVNLAFGVFVILLGIEENVLGLVQALMVSGIVFWVFVNDMFESKSASESLSTFLLFCVLAFCSLVPLGLFLLSCLCRTGLAFVCSKFLMCLLPLSCVAIPPTSESVGYHR